MRISFVLALAAATWGGAATVSAQSARSVDLTLSQVVDSARLTEVVRAIPGLPTKGVSVYAVSYDSTGAIDSVTVMAVRDSAKDAEVVAAIRGAARPTQEAGHESDLLIRASWQGGPVLSTFQTRNMRQPALRNPGVLQQGFSSLATRFVSSLRPGGEQIMLRMRVDQNGAPGQITIERGTGMPEIDLGAVRVARQARFRPASIDGIPVGVWVALPVIVKIEQRANPPLGAPRP